MSERKDKPFGEDFMSFADVLDEATRDGIQGVTIARDDEGHPLLLQMPTAENGNIAAIAYRVEMKDGRVFEDVGDANPTNVGRMILPHLFRMASTRAQARCLSHAINKGKAVDVELDGDREASDEPPRESLPPAATTARQSAPAEAARVEGGLSPTRQANANQLAILSKLSNQLGEEPGPTEHLSEAEATARIAELSKRYNDRVGAHARRTA